jgi:1-phosphatidylinositol phosphodiesterase
MTGPIIIRNLTAQPLTVTHLERFAAPNAKDFPPNAGFSVNNITANITSIFNGTSSAGSESTSRRNSIGRRGSSSRRNSAEKLGENAESFTKQDVEIRLEPFTTNRTEVTVTERNPNDILRLTLQGEGGEKWRCDAPTPGTTFDRLVPLTPDPKHEYTALYLPSTSVLAVMEVASYHNWMKEFEDGTPISALSIPGTHNSPTCYKALPSVRCQAVGPLEQLRNGVRFFDIRVQPSHPSDDKDDSLALVHGVFPISLTGTKKFRALEDEMRTFLRENPSETIIVSLKREGSGDATDAQLSKILRDHYTSSDLWYTDPRIPTLGQVRGKVVLMRRFAIVDNLKSSHGGRGWGLNAENWAYNTPNDKHGDVVVQDFCEVLETENIDHKIKLCCEHFERSAQVCAPVGEIALKEETERRRSATERRGSTAPPVNTTSIYLNFLSASNFWKVGCWPDKIAAKLNPAVTSFLVEKHDIGDKGVDAPGEQVEGDGGTGIVVCDWVGKDGDWDLVRTIVGMNSKLLKRQRGIGWR